MLTLKCKKLTICDDGISLSHKPDPRMHPFLCWSGMVPIVWYVLVAICPWISCGHLADTLLLAFLRNLFMLPHPPFRACDLASGYYRGHSSYLHALVLVWTCPRLSMDLLWTQLWTLLADNSLSISVNDFRRSVTLDSFACGDSSVRIHYIRYTRLLQAWLCFLSMFQHRYTGCVHATFLPSRMVHRTGIGSVNTLSNPSSLQICHWHAATSM